MVSVTGTQSVWKLRPNQRLSRSLCQKMGMQRQFFVFTSTYFPKRQKAPELSVSLTLEPSEP